MPARSHESISPSNGAILRGWVPFRDVPAGGTAGKPADRYFFTVRQSQPTSAAISAYDAPASCKARNLRMFIQLSGCRIIEEITLRCSRLGSRRNEGWSTSQGRQGHITRTPAPGHSARNPHAQPRKPLPPHSRTGPARQGTYPAHPGRHIRSYAIRQHRSYADTRADAVNPVWNRTWLEYSQARGFHTDPARVRAPRDKGRVEAGVKFVQVSFFAGEQFTGLADARARE